MFINLSEEEQFNRRIFELSQAVDPLDARLAGFLAQHSKEKPLAITVGLEPTDIGSLKALTDITVGRQMTHTAREMVETREQAAIRGLAAALQSEDASERVADPIEWAPHGGVPRRERDVSFPAFSSNHEREGIARYSFAKIGFLFEESVRRRNDESGL
jgi:hypothetical protein